MPPRGANGPLAGLRVVEFTGLGPAPFATMLLSDLGADVLRIDRPGTPHDPNDLLARGRRSLVLDLKSAADRAVARAAVARADVLIEGFRPGVMERLGLGPDVLLAENPRLVYGRMTGWGQDGPLAPRAGHDINYIALCGALGAIGPAGAPPTPPLNLVGDFGGGALYLALGVVAALFERQHSGCGQVIDAAMVDGGASLLAMLLSHRAADPTADRGRYFLDGSAPYYRCYACADGRWIAVGALEPQFYGELLRHAGVENDAPARDPHPAWESTAAWFERLFRRRTRDEWIELFRGTDACVAPVLAIEEAEVDAHLRARGTYSRAFGRLQPAPAPRFSRTPAAIQGPPVAPGSGGEELLRQWGIDDAAVRAAASP
ncbi:MAG TPA: CaiB/BaiF CoA-transferase family protein [Burkholderiaceae bacterium]|nr:CaiB/BaiF CoA-transferase family protein [Burkholderiaceae bacterium]